MNAYATTAQYVYVLTKKANLDNNGIFVQDGKQYIRLHSGRLVEVRETDEANGLCFVKDGIIYYNKHLLQQQNVSLANFVSGG